MKDENSVKSCSRKKLIECFSQFRVSINSNVFQLLQTFNLMAYCNHVNLWHELTSLSPGES